MPPSFSDQFAGRVHQAQRTLQFLWAALMMSVGTYGVVLYMVQRTESELEPPPAILTYVFPIVALVIVATAVILFRAMASPDRMRAVLNAGHAPDAADNERRLSQVPQLLFTLYIVRWALFESVAILGLVLGILHHSFVPFVPFGAVSIALIALTPPKVKQLVDDAIALLPSAG